MAASHIVCSAPLMHVTLSSSSASASVKGVPSVLAAPLAGRRVDEGLGLWFSSAAKDARIFADACTLSQSSRYDF